MPLFSTKKFSSRKIPQRKLLHNFPDNTNKQEELGFEIGKIKLNIGDHEAVFDNGEWIPESGEVGNKQKENQQLKRQVQQLEAENNFLRLKTEVLLDMLTETTAEAHIQDKEITRLRHELSQAITE